MGDITNTPESARISFLEKAQEKQEEKYEKLRDNQESFKNDLRERHEILTKELRDKQEEIAVNLNSKENKITTRTIGGIASVLALLFSFFAYLKIEDLVAREIQKQVGTEYLDKLSQIDSIKFVAEEAAGRIHTIEEQIGQDNWIKVEFQNNWQDHGNIFNPCGYVKDEIGRVHLRGLIKLGDQESTIFTLPKDYRPKFQEMFVVSTNQTNKINGTTRIDVKPNGEVALKRAYDNWVSLDGISFSSTIVDKAELTE